MQHPGRDRRRVFPAAGLQAKWDRCERLFRDPAEVAGHLSGFGQAEADLLRGRTQGPFWDILKELDVSLLVTREYEHLVLALSPIGPAATTYFRLPHPSGVAVDSGRGRVYVAATRNPNQIFEFAPAEPVDERSSFSGPPPPPLLPRRAIFYPGSLYIHELAIVGRGLFANAVGTNSVVKISDTGDARRVWWPRCLDTLGTDAFTRNYLQLNSIAAGGAISSSFFSASTDRPSRRRPGHRNFPVDGKGVIFSGRTGEVVARGLTRPHSARLHRGKLWVDNSGYGEVGCISDGRLTVAARLPGWTRGLCFRGDIMFVGTSRIIQRFHHYAPGLEPSACVCGVHVLEASSGRRLAGIVWPAGYQIFSVECLPRDLASGFPFRVSRPAPQLVRKLFFRYKTVAGKPNQGVKHDR